MYLFHNNTETSNKFSSIQCINVIRFVRTLYFLLIDTHMLVHEGFFFKTDEYITKFPISLINNHYVNRYRWDIIGIYSKYRKIPYYLVITPSTNANVVYQHTDIFQTNASGKCLYIHAVNMCHENANWNFF